MTDKDSFDLWWAWAEKPLDSLMTIPAEIHDADRRGDGVRLSDLEPRFTCQACGQKRRGRPPEFQLEIGRPAPEVAC